MCRQLTAVCHHSNPVFYFLLCFVVISTFPAIAIPKPVLYKIFLAVVPSKINNVGHHCSGNRAVPCKVALQFSCQSLGIHLQSPEHECWGGGVHWNTNEMPVLASCSELAPCDFQLFPRSRVPELCCNLISLLNTSPFGTWQVLWSVWSRQMSHPQAAPMGVTIFHQEEKWISSGNLHCQAAWFQSGPG